MKEYAALNDIIFSHFLVLRQTANITCSYDESFTYKKFSQYTQEGIHLTPNSPDLLAMLRVNLSLL